MKNFKPVVWPIAWAVVILILCLMPKSDLPEQRFINIPHFDKWVHVGLFFVFYLTLNFVSPSRWIQNLIICVCYGALIEVLQVLVPTGRSAEWIDLLADGFGATFAAVFALTVRRRRFV